MRRQYKTIQYNMRQSKTLQDKTNIYNLHQDNIVQHKGTQQKNKT